MRAAPAVRVVVGDRGVWSSAVLSATLTAGAVCLTWLLQSAGDLSAWSIAVMAALLATILAQALRTLRVAALALRWDTRAWQLEWPGGAAPVEGQIVVALDVGDWMLLRFDATPATPAPGRAQPARRHWLPVRRTVVGGSWHALRCAVHAHSSQAPQTTR